MKGKKWLILLAGLAVVLLASSIGVTRSSFVDLETSSGNTFQGWVSNLWQQTTQAQFNDGVLTNVNTSSSPGDVKLAVKSNWYNTSWQYRRAITINHTNVQDVANPSTTYANFPVLVYATGLSNIKANGADIRFTLSNGVTELPREIESYAGGTLYAWVKVTLTKDSSDSSDDVIYMYYGNAAATEPAPSSTYGSQNVWDGNLKAVWHLKEDPSPAPQTVNDSTINGNNGTSQSGVTLDAAGKIDGAESFDGIVGWISLGTSASLNFGANVPFTIEGWYKTTESYGTIFSFRHGTNDYPIIDICVGYDGAVNSAGRLMALVRDDINSGGYARVTGPTVNDGNWHYFVLTRNAGNTIQLFSDGVLQGTNSGTGAGGAITTNIRALASERRWVQVGYGNADQRYLVGTTDEVRVSNVQRSSSWVSTCYNNQNSPSTFCSRGSEEGQYVSSGTIASQVLNTGVDGARWDALFWDETVEAGVTDITFEVRAANTLVGGFPDASWIPVGGTSPVTSGLPSGRYKQWQATLTTSDASKTPTLHEVRVYYY